MSNFPRTTDLVSSIEFRLHPSFEIHPTEVHNPKPFDAWEYIHRVLTVRPKDKYDGPLGANDALHYDFLVESLTSEAPTGHTGYGHPFLAHIDREQQVQDFIDNKIGGGVDFDDIRGSGITQTPYDVPVKKQCFIILELDRKLKWRFTKGSPGITMQEFYGTDNFDMVYRKSTAAKSFSNPETERFIAVDDCKVLYFKVGRRRSDVQKLNFHIEFQWDVGKFVPMIFDPNVPDSGGASFP